MRPFVVLSLPRSRSAWLSHYLAWRGRFAIGHDIVVECKSLEQFQASFANGMHGTVETGAVLAWRLLRHRMPQARVVTLHRPLEEIERSLRTCGLIFDSRDLELRSELLRECSRQPGVTSLTSRDLSDPSCAQWIFEHLLEVPWDEPWWREINQVNIQINMERRKLRLEQNAQALQSLRQQCEALTRALPCLH